MYREINVIYDFSEKLAKTIDPKVIADLALEEGAYVPIAFANWDGVAGESGGRHSYTSWYWLRLEPSPDPVRLYGLPALFALIVGALFLLAARSQRRRFT